MIAACDMGPLHDLVLIGCDHILPRLFDRVVTARLVVEREMSDPRTPEPVRLRAADPPRWLEDLEPQIALRDSGRSRLRPSPLLPTRRETRPPGEAPVGPTMSLQAVEALPEPSGTTAHRESGASR